MLPILRQLADSREHSVSDLYVAIAEALSVSEADQSELLASGKQTRFENRVGWARTYLSKDGLIESPRRDVSRITARGLEVLQDSPPRLDISYLQRFPEFELFRLATR